MISLPIYRVKALAKLKKKTLETGRIIEGRKNKNTDFITLQKMLYKVAACVSESKSYLHCESRHVYVILRK